MRRETTKQSLQANPVKSTWGSRMPLMRTSFVSSASKSNTLVGSKPLSLATWFSWRLSRKAPRKVEGAPVTIEVPNAFRAEKGTPDRARCPPAGPRIDRFLEPVLVCFGSRLITLFVDLVGFALKLHKESLQNTQIASHLCKARQRSCGGLTAVAPVTSKTDQSRMDVLHIPHRHGSCQALLAWWSSPTETTPAQPGVRSFSLTLAQRTTVLKLQLGHLL